MPQDAHIRQRNDVAEIALHESYGLVCFHEMGAKPGEILPTASRIMLTSHNLDRFRGHWRRMMKVTSLPQFYDLAKLSDS